MAINGNSGLPRCDHTAWKIVADMHTTQIRRNTRFVLTHLLFASMVALLTDRQVFGQTAAPVALNTKADGYRGVWYMNQPSHDEYVYKYSGGLGTYCAKHKPFAIYSQEVHKTFFCFGGTTRGNNRQLLHMYRTSITPRRQSRVRRFCWTKRHRRRRTRGICVPLISTRAPRRTRLSNQYWDCERSIAGGLDDV